MQRHEFANRLHVAAGLLDAGRADEARAFLAELLDRGPVRLPGGRHSTASSDPLLQSFLGAKAIEAGERGVAAADRRRHAAARHADRRGGRRGRARQPARQRRVAAAVARRRAARVEVALLDDGDALV